MRIVGEPLKIHNLVQSKAEYKERIEETLYYVLAFSPDTTDRYTPMSTPAVSGRGSLSHGPWRETPSLNQMRRRLYQALDVSMQAQILNLLQDLRIVKTAILDICSYPTTFLPCST